MRIIRSQTPRPLTLLAMNAGGTLAAASWVFGASGDVEIWQTATGGRQFTHPLSEREPHSLLFAPDGRRLVVGEWKRITVIDTLTQATTDGPAVIYGFPQCVLSPTGEVVFTESYNGRSHLVCYTDISPTASRLKWKSNPREGFASFGCLAISRTGQVLAVRENALGLHGTDGEIQFRDTATGQVRAAISTDDPDRLLGFAFTADGAKLVVRNDSRTVQLFDAVTGAAAGELVHPGRPYVTGIAVHPRGPIACARTNGTVTLWDAGTREQIRALDWKAGRLVSVAFSPDGTIGAAGTEDGKLIVWDVDL